MSGGKTSICGRRPVPLIVELHDRLKGYWLDIAHRPYPDRMLVPKQAPRGESLERIMNIAPSVLPSAIETRTELAWWAGIIGAPLMSRT